MLYKLISKTTPLLSKKEIKNICILKDTQWKHGIKSQLNWYKKNIKKENIHNLLFINSKLIGYTLLRKRTCFVNKVKKNTYFLIRLCWIKNIEIKSHLT